MAVATVVATAAAVMVAEEMEAVATEAVVTEEEMEEVTEAAKVVEKAAVETVVVEKAAAETVVAVMVAEKAAAVRAGVMAARRSPHPRSIGPHAALPQNRKRNSQCCRQSPRHDAPWRWRAHIPPRPKRTRRHARSRCSG